MYYGPVGQVCVHVLYTRNQVKNTSSLILQVHVQVPGINRCLSPRLSPLVEKMKQEKKKQIFHRSGATVPVQVR